MGNLQREWSYKTWSARTDTRKISSAFGKAGPQLTPSNTCCEWWMTIWATGGWHTRARSDLSKRTPQGRPLKGHGLVHSFETSCMTISCAWTYLLERASSTSRTTHCAPLTTSESWSWGSMTVCGGWGAKRWLDRRDLKMAPEMTEALLVTDKRSFQYPNIVLGKHEIQWKKSIKYLGVQSDRRLSFGEHLQIATAKAIQCGAALTRRTPNIGGPREAKRRLSMLSRRSCPRHREVWCWDMSQHTELCRRALCWSWQASHQ